VSENNQISISAPLEKVEHKSRVVPIENPQEAQKLKGANR